MPVRDRTRRDRVGRCSRVAIVAAVALAVTGAGCATSASSTPASTASTPATALPDRATGPVAARTTGTQVAPDLVDRYRAYVLAEAMALQSTTRTFTDAIRAGDLSAAQRAYEPARVHYERMEPVAELFEDLDAAIDSRVEAHNGVDDPEWYGFHKLEHALFQLQSTAGLTELADKLDDDVVTLIGWVERVKIEPIDVVKGARELLEEVAQSKVTGEEEKYSHTDLADFQANVDGAQEVWTLVTPAVTAADRATAADIDAKFASVDSILATYRNPDGTFRLYGALSEPDKQQLAADIAGLSEAMAQLPGTLGLA